MPESPLNPIPPPYALSLLVCDNIWKDQLSGKTYILGTFTSVKAHSFPAVHPQMAIHLTLTNGRGKNDIRVRLIDSDEERDPIWQAELEVDFPDPRVMFEIGFVLGAVPFPAPGEYRIQVHRGSDFIIERRVLAIQPKPPAPLPPPEETEGDDNG